MKIVWILFFIVFARAEYLDWTVPIENFPLRRMVINPKTDDVFVVGKDTIFQLTGSNLKVSHKAVTGPLIDNANCWPSTWTVFTGNCFSGGNARFSQSNFNQLLLFNESGDSLLACGNLETRTCDLHDTHDVEMTLLNETDTLAAAVAEGVVISELLVVSRDVASNTAGVVSYDYLGRPALFVAATVRSSVTTTFLPPTFAVRSMTPTEFLLPLAKLELKKFTFPILGSFASGNFVYFLSNDNRNLLSQICRQDAGFVPSLPTYIHAYMEARLYCNGFTLTYKYMTSFLLNPASANLAKGLNISVGNDVLIGVYNTMADGSGSSAICVVALETIERTYKERQDRCRNGEAGVERGFGREVSPLDLQQCSKVASGIWDGSTCAPPFQLLLEIPENEPIIATALYEQTSGLTAVSSVSIANDTILFAGQSDGKILKLLLTYGLYPRFVSTISTSLFQPIKELKLSYDQSHLFALTDSHVTRIPIQECDSLRNCFSCFSTADPFCEFCHHSTFYNLLRCLSDAQPLCTSPLLVSTQPKTVYRLNGTSLDFIAANQTSLRIDWRWKLNGSSLLLDVVTGNGSNFFHPIFDTRLLRIQSVGSELDRAMFKYTIPSQILGQPPVFTSDFITVVIGSGAAITTTNMSNNGTVKVIEKTQETIYIETEGLPSVNKTALKLDQGNWNITRLGLFHFTDELLNINPSSVEDSGIYRIDVSNCFNTSTIEFNLIVEASTSSPSTSSPSTRAHSTRTPSTSSPSTSSPSIISPSTSSSFDYIRSVIVPVATCFGVVALLLFVFLCIRRKRAKQADIGHHLELPTYHPPHLSCDYDTSEPPDQWEIARDALKLLEVLGQGFFGIVLKGNLSNNFLYLSRSMPSFRRKQKDRCIARTVACKMLKESATEENQKELLEEIKLMKRIGEHKHIVSMVGCITRSHPICLVVEYCSGGDLLGYLKKGRKPYVEAPLSESENRLPSGVADLSKKATSSLDEKGLLSSAPNEKNEQRDDGVLTPEELMSFSWQISSGMDYLSGKGMVHRDLACRNVLVVKGKFLKVSDFGLTRAVYQDGKYAQKTTRHLPLRWMLIEAIVDREFSEKSDIWSFGIVIWEICTLGCFPYPLMSTEDFLHFLRKGNRLNRPENCSEELYSVMLQCWDAEPNKRPCFSDVEKQLRQIMDCQSPSSYVKFDFSNMIAIWKAADSVEEKQERDGDSVQEVDEVDATERDQSDMLDN